MKVKSDEPAIAIVGAGNAGIIAALAIALQHPERSIVLVDPAKVAGGSYASFKTPEGWEFDRGIHLIPEISPPLFQHFFSGDNGFDDSFWRELIYPVRDRHGKIYGGRIYPETSLPDVALLPDEIAAKVRNEFEAGSALHYSEAETAGVFFETNFGPTFKIWADHYFMTLFGVPSDQLASSVVSFAPFSRLVLADVDKTIEMMAADRYRSRIGFPHQEKLPAALQPGSVNRYPRKAGIGQFIEKIEHYLHTRGCSILLGANLVQFAFGDDGQISACEIDADGESQTVPCDHVIWTAPLFPLNQVLARSSADASWVPETKRPDQVLEFIHFTTGEPIFESNAFYYYDLDPSIRFRITNYAAYTHHPAGNAYTLEYVRPISAPSSTEQAARSEVDNFLTTIKCESQRSENIWVDPARIPVPCFSLPTNENTVVTNADTKPENLHLFGPSANQSFVLSRDIYSESADLVKGL